MQSTHLSYCHTNYELPKYYVFGNNVITVLELELERLEVGTVHMCLSSVSGYRLHNLNPPPSLGNLLLDITLCSISFRCRFVVVVFFCYF